MLKRIKKLLSNPISPKSLLTPTIIPSSKHRILPSDISSAARKIVRELEDNGFQAYVVGGCIRDLLLGLHPKDFDVATNATPEQVHGLFRGARIIGRRFRIVHVRMGRDIVEVTTFRAHHNGEHQDHAHRSEEGLLLRDNVFGNIDEDAARRDFTVNALYYHPSDNTVYDYAGGLADIKDHRLRIIGDPETRFREDPVRMLRAARFAAKLGFELDEKTASAIVRLNHLLQGIPPARLYDEVLKLFMSGHALAGFHALQQFNLFAPLFPDTYTLLGKDHYQAFIEQALTNTDLRIRNNKPVTPAFLLATLLWPPVVTLRKKYMATGESPLYAQQQAANEVVARQITRITIPRRFSLPMREIWDMQLRLLNRGGRRAERLLGHPRFRAGYDFLLLREEIGENLDGLGLWWTQFQEATPSEREQMVQALGGKPSGQRRRRRKRRASS